MQNPLDKPSPANIEAAKKLIDKYESLTLKDVIGKDPVDTTGLGSASKCILCASVGIISSADQEHCQYCIYGSNQACYRDPNNAPTYRAIELAKSPEARLKAYYDRAQHIRGILEKITLTEKEEKSKYFDLSELSEASDGHLFSNENAIKAGFHSNLCIQIRKSGLYANKAFFLHDHYNWELKTDPEGDLCLIPTKKK